MAEPTEGRHLKVAFDEQAFLLQEYGGISRYLCNLAQCLSCMPDVDVQVSAPLHFNRNLAAMDGVAGFRRLVPKLSTKMFRPVRALSYGLADWAINRFKPDILHETYYTNTGHRPRGARHVLTVYDLIHERYGEMFENSDLTIGPKKAAALRADHVICISESTRRDLVTMCGVPVEKTTVIYLGADLAFLSASPAKDVGSRPYLLYVGNRDGYKNFSSFLSAYAASTRLKSEFDIVCFGGGLFNAGEWALANKLGVQREHLIHRAGPDIVLAGLYRNAHLFVYPSLYEGFGIPPLEAMAADCPVVCSNTSSLPEVVGEAGEYFDPTNEESMMVAMETVAFSESRRVELVALGRIQSSKFSWEKCALETLDVYRRLL